jgi:anti-sigma-K factor RskA
LKVTSEITPEQAQMAAELALGVLEGEERAEALRLSLTNPAFAALVAQWQGQLDPLGEAFEETPPPDLWRAIEARLDPEPQAGTIHKLRFWQGLAAASGAIAAGLAAIMVLGPATNREVPDPAAPPASATVAIAQLTGTDGTMLAAKIDPQGQYLDIRAIALPDSGLTPELWVIPGNGVPRSLGLIARAGTTQVRLPDNLRPLVTEGAMLAVSLELAEGAPHEAPSSTPIAIGKISAI